MLIAGLDIRVYFLLFMVYSILGWSMEVICKFIQYKRFINRGFLVGPYCPIYGYGALLITFLLEQYVNDPFVLFIMAILICGTLEYLTSFFMEKIYKARWWDYSQKKFNINGRVCLETIIPFGILGLLIMYILNPFFIENIEKIPNIWLNILFWLFLAVYILDNIISEVVIRYVKKTEKRLGNELDNTEEITKRVKEVLQNKSVLHRRLVNAYPKLQAVKFKIEEKKKEIKQKEEKLKQDIDDRSNKIKEKFKDK